MKYTYVYLILKSARIPLQDDYLDAKFAHLSSQSEKARKLTGAASVVCFVY